MGVPHLSCDWDQLEDLSEGTRQTGVGSLDRILQVEPPQRKGAASALWRLDLKKCILKARSPHYCLRIHGRCNRQLKLPMVAGMEDNSSLAKWPAVVWELAGEDNLAFKHEGR